MSIGEPSEAFDMSEEDMPFLLEEFNTIMEIDIEEPTECESLQSCVKKTSPHHYIDYELDIVL